MSWKGTLVYRAAASGNQTIVDNTNTAVSFSAEAYDHIEAYTADEPTRLTIPGGTTGLFRLTAGILWSAGIDTSAARRCWFRKNGTDAVQGLPAYQTTANGLNFNLSSPPITLSAGDYIELMVYQNNAGANPAIVANGTCFLAIEELPADLLCAMVRTNANINFPANNGSTTLGWTTEVYDTGGWADLGTQSTRLTVPADVTHIRLHAGCRMSADMEVGANDVNIFQLGFLKNGSAFTGANGVLLIDPTDTAAQNQAAWLSTPWVSTVATDYYQVNLFSSHSGSHQVLSHEETFFAIEALTDVATEIGVAELIKAGMFHRGPFGRRRGRK
jgi:hypothetical protein